MKLVTAQRVDALDDGKCGARLAQTGLRLTPEAKIVDELGEFDPPRIVTARKLPSGGFRRSHLRQHLVIGQPLEAVAAAQAFNMQLRVTSVDLEREEILP